MTEEQKIKRGKEILTQLEKDKWNFDLPKVQRDYACMITHAVAADTHDVPIPEERMCIALCEAELQGLRVNVVPNTKYQSKGEITPPTQFDGWEYHIELMKDN